MLLKGLTTVAQDTQQPQDYGPFQGEFFKTLLLPCNCFLLTTAFQGLVSFKTSCHACICAKETVIYRSVPKRFNESWCCSSSQPHTFWPISAHHHSNLLTSPKHLRLGFYLLLHFDYCFSLNPEPPHQLYVSSLLLPAVHLSRHRESAAPRPVPKRPDARGAPVPRGEEVLETGEQRVTGDVSRGSAPVGATERRPEGMLDLDEID